MKITKRNDNSTLYDDEKLIRSILNANREVPREEMSEAVAARLADEVMAGLTADNEIITTAEIIAVIQAVNIAFFIISIASPTDLYLPPPASSPHVHDWRGKCSS